MCPGSHRERLRTQDRVGCLRGEEEKERRKGGLEGKEAFRVVVLSLCGKAGMRESDPAACGTGSRGGKGSGMAGR